MLLKLIIHNGLVFVANDQWSPVAHYRSGGIKRARVFAVIVDGEIVKVGVKDTQDMTHFLYSP